MSSGASIPSASRLPGDVEHASTETPDRTVEHTAIEEIEEELTNRWFGITAIGMISAGFGIIFARPSLIAVAGVAVWFAVYARLTSPPEPDLSLTRHIADPEAAPGEEVEVTLRIGNVGDHILPDVRVVDGVPPAIKVASGSPRRATTLRPGQEVRIGYTIETRLGHHVFDPTTVMLRDLAGSHELTYEATVPSTLHGEPEPRPLPMLPLRQLTRRVTGRVETKQGGSGLEFFATREYRPGDSLNRVDWNRLARTGRLSTLQFREEQAATVILVIDVRPEAYVAAPDQELPAADVGIAAASDLFFSLLDVGDRVGLTTLGDRSCWLPPGLGSDHRAAGRILFGGHPSLGPKPPSEHVSVDYQRWQLQHRLPLEAQIIYINPFADDGAERYATMLDARGHLVTALSPDPTGRDTPGQLLATVERQLRIYRLRERGIRVIDWDVESPLALAIERAAIRW